MIKIAPSILSADFTQLGRSLDSVKNADLIHFDVMDGAFVPNISFGLPVLKAVREYTDAMLDVHLMIEKPERYIDDFAAAGADLISVHLEADSPRGIRRALDAMNAAGVKKAVALRPITSPNAILPYLEELDLVLVMTVEPGFGGQKFMTDMMPKVTQIREWIEQSGRDIDLQVDGGVNGQTAQVCIEAGANVLVAGSYLFSKDDYAAALRSLIPAEQA